MSDFGTATLDLAEKTAYSRFLPKPIPNLTEVRNGLSGIRGRMPVKIFLEEMYGGRR